MESETFASYSHHLQTVAIATIFFAICLLFPKLTYQTSLAKLPLFGNWESGEKQRQLYLNHAKKIYSAGYEKFKDSAYRVATNDGEDNVVIAPRFLPELRKLPDSVLSFPKAIDKVMEVKYTKILTDAPMIVHSVKADLTPALARLNSVVYDEVVESLSEEIPACDDWTPVNMYMALANMVAKISGRVFVGPELCRDKDYLESAIQYTMDVIEVQRSVKLIRPWLRPILAPRLPAVKRLRKREQMAEDLLTPIIASRLEAERNDPTYKKPDDMLSWFMNRSADYGGHSNALLAKFQLGLIFAAIHTTTLTGTNILYTLASQPEYAEPLREEIRAVMAENGGVITTRALQQMVKLDSYMKEVVRFYPLGVTSFTRKVLRGFTLSNGQYIPPGVTIETPSHAVYSDPVNYSETAHVFDGFRFSKIREGGKAADHARNQFVTTNEQNLMFGYGRHACPGRFFAANEIKMLVAKMLLDFDIKNEGDSQERYPNIEMGRQTSVDARKNLLLKRVQV
ncbi:cytochrome P450 monooxygenase-like protein [Massarina eburnea CBS 473.64]|uniref:Cytochrome P450 monooxygenase-like protein n=1 Tax=Massarina eburnea CBS 473.64 TaxID=1395130 RepID=A0A6A6RM33_9PLEO|nr:cytochrome P450 monooxygenase-like protein [Massarina eburnea CBS 473.64]